MKPPTTDPAGTEPQSKPSNRFLQKTKGFLAKKIEERKRQQAEKNQTKITALIRMHRAPEGFAPTLADHEGFNPFRDSAAEKNLKTCWQTHISSVFPSNSDPLLEDNLNDTNNLSFPYICGATSLNNIIIQAANEIVTNASRHVYDVTAFKKKLQAQRTSLTSQTDGLTIDKITTLGENPQEVLSLLRLVLQAGRIHYALLDASLPRKEASRAQQLNAFQSWLTDEYYKPVFAYFAQTFPEALPGPTAVEDSAIVAEPKPKASSPSGRKRKKRKKGQRQDSKAKTPTNPINMASSSDESTDSSEPKTPPRRKPERKSRLPAPAAGPEMVITPLATPRTLKKNGGASSTPKPAAPTPAEEVPLTWADLPPSKPPQSQKAAQPAIITNNDAVAPPANTQQRQHPATPPSPSSVVTLAHPPISRVATASKASNSPTITQAALAEQVNKLREDLDHYLSKRSAYSMFRLSLFRCTALTENKYNIAKGLDEYLADLQQTRLADGNISNNKLHEITEELSHKVSRIGLQNRNLERERMNYLPEEAYVGGPAINKTYHARHLSSRSDKQGDYGRFGKLLKTAQTRLDDMNQGSKTPSTTQTLR